MEIYCTNCHRQVEFYKSERVSWICCYWCDRMYYLDPEKVS